MKTFIWRNIIVMLYATKLLNFKHLPPTRGRNIVHLIAKIWVNITLAGVLAIRGVVLTGANRPATGLFCHLMLHFFIILENY